MVLVLTWWVFTPSASRLAIELLHARPRIAKALRKSKRPVGTIALLFSLSPVWKKEFLVPSMAFGTADAFDNVCCLDRNGTLDEVPQNKSRRLLLDYFLTNSMNETLLGLFPVEPRKSWDRSVVIEFQTSCHHMKLVSRASRPGLTVGIPRILCNGLCG